MSIKLRLIVMNFLQFAVWGAWLISLGSYVGGGLGFNGTQIGSFFATMGLASLVMPALMGIVADRWMPACCRGLPALWRWRRWPPALLAPSCPRTTCCNPALQTAPLSGPFLLLHSVMAQGAACTENGRTWRQSWLKGGQTALPSDTMAA